MANVFTDLIPVIIGKLGIVLRENSRMPRLIDNSIGSSFKEEGDTVRVPLSVAQTVANASPSSTPLATADKTPTYASVTLDQWKKTDFHLNDKDAKRIMADKHFIPGQMAEAARALGNNVDNYIFALYKNSTNGIFSGSGTAGTTPFGSDTTAATNARKLLNKQLSPMDPRYGVLDPDAEAAFLEQSKFGDLEKTGDPAVKIKGLMGEKYGMGWSMNQNVPTHTAGTIADGAAARKAYVNNSAGYAIGVADIALDKGGTASLTGTILQGDIVSFANHDQQYMCIANVTAAADAIASFTFYPALKAALVDDEAMTVVASHVLNLGFHKGCFAMASRPMTDLFKGGDVVETVVDPITGLAFRLTVTRQTFQTAFILDILYGASLIRPELGTRIFG